MIVTRIEAFSRSRSKIYLDDSFAFVLNKGELHLYGIREGEELKEEAYRDILENLLGKRATVRCMNLLKGRPYTEKQLRDKLAEGLYPASCVEQALSYVKSYGYVDDARYAQEYIACMQAKKSRRMMEQELARRGIGPDLIEAAFLCLQENGELEQEEALAIQWMKKQHYDAKSADYKQKQKMAAFLYRRGIGTDTIYRVLRDGDRD